MGPLRQVLKPLYRYFREPGYREYLRVQRTCRNKKDQPVSILLDGFMIEGIDGPSLLHLYEEIVVRKSFDFDIKGDSPVIYCCGANIGLEILRLEKFYPSARIKAFEADPQIFSILKSNLERNDSRAEIHNVAISTQNGKVAFLPDGKLGGKTGAGTEEVPSVRLNDLLAQERRVDLLIMDIEGAENNVLPDCADNLNKVDLLFVEWHGEERQPQDLPSILELLRNKGFRYRLNNNLGPAPFQHSEAENGFDAMVEIYATRTRP